MLALSLTTEARGESAWAILPDGRIGPCVGRWRSGTRRPEELTGAVLVAPWGGLRGGSPRPAPGSSDSAALLAYKARLADWRRWGTSPRPIPPGSVLSLARAHRRHGPLAILPAMEDERGLVPVILPTGVVRRAAVAAALLATRPALGTEAAPLGSAIVDRWGLRPCWG